MDTSFNRDQAIARLEDSTQVWDVVIIGGGATGVAAALEASSRGYKTALCERFDFAKGTSSRSTKIIHGGVRYLKQGNISLVRDGLRERGLLLRNAPHLVRRMQFIIPAEKWLDLPFYGMGLKIYDKLAGKLSLGKSMCLGRNKVTELLPGIQCRKFRGGILYYDAQFDDARLVVEFAKTASIKGATLCNYLEVVAFVKNNNTITGVRVCDAESGNEFEIKAKCVINATGAYADSLLQLDDKAASPTLSPSQGTHIVLPKRFFPSTTALLIPKTQDGRVLFAIPWHDHVLVGTTDTPVENCLAEPKPFDEEIAFLLEHAGCYLESAPMRQDVLSVFAGLRPLISKGGGKTAALSRDHAISIAPSGLITISGGKWTTCRKMGEDVVNQMELVGGFVRKPSVTAQISLAGCTDSNSHEDSLAVYGAAANSIRNFVDRDPNLGKKLHPLLPNIRAEVLWAVQMEMARTVEDVLARRTRILFLNARAAIDVADEVAKIVAIELGCDAQWANTNAEHFRSCARSYLLESV